MPICSKNHEIETWKKIGKIVEDRLDRYANPLDEDIDILEYDSTKRLMNKN